MDEQNTEKNGLETEAPMEGQNIEELGSETGTLKEGQNIENQGSETGTPKKGKSTEKHISEIEERTVGGFLFEDYKDAQEAFREQRNVRALKDKIDFEQTEEMAALYNKLIEGRVFKTPIGLKFLGEFREFLVEDVEMPEADVPLIYVLPSKGMPRAKKEQLEFLLQENQKMESDRRKYIISIIALIVVILAMFAITVLNPNVGYINTENKILNRYASWEEELTRREAELREREAQLGITSAPDENTESISK